MSNPGAVGKAVNMFLTYFIRVRSKQPRFPRLPQRNDLLLSGGINRISCHSFLIFFEISCTFSFSLFPLTSGNIIFHLSFVTRESRRCDPRSPQDFVEKWYRDIGSDTEMPNEASVKVSRLQRPRA